MITAQPVGHAAAVLHPDPSYVYAPTVPYSNMFHGHQTYTYQPAMPIMYHPYTANPTMSNMYTMPYNTDLTMNPVPYPMNWAVNNTNDSAIWSPTVFPTICSDWNCTRVYWVQCGQLVHTLKSATREAGKTAEVQAEGGRC